MLPAAVATELWDVARRPCDICLDYLYDDISAYGFAVLDVADRDLAITIRFGLKESLEGMVVGSVRIDRLERCFNVEAHGAAGQFLPAAGNWEDVRRYLDNLSRACHGEG